MFLSPVSAYPCFSGSSVNENELHVWMLPRLQRFPDRRQVRLCLLHGKHDREGALAAHSVRLRIRSSLRAWK